ncbi:DedA family protein [Wohlfahrtiimonas larvae]|uniref:DedA family protein n=1 Tax=Wohlfahrtiimonas larvae TaxID=1157986 RepID=A0ABP9MZF4_9GAMM|nr:DedA family protein [Wohlfahrtiimonas larvae]
MTEIFMQFIDLFLNLDKYLEIAVQQYGIWIYIILIIIIFCETGLVITPILPGDSLLFAAGALAAMGLLNIYLLFFTLLIAAILGDALNYQIGHYVGLKVFKQDAKIFKLKYLEKTHNFYEKYGSKTIVIARFVPIVRTFAPFVAGASKMTYKTFATYNIFGAFLWMFLMLGAGYIFGTIPWIKNNFSIIVLGIIFISILPMIYEIGKAWLEHRKKNQ